MNKARDRNFVRSACDPLPPNRYGLRWMFSASVDDSEREDGNNACHPNSERKLSPLHKPFA